MTVSPRLPIAASAQFTDLKDLLLSASPTMNSPSQKRSRVKMRTAWNMNAEV